MSHICALWGVCSVAASKVQVQRAARKWERFIENRFNESSVRGVVTFRTECFNHDRVRLRVEDIDARLDANRELIDVASDHFKWLSMQLNDFPHVISLTDREGVCLYSTGDVPNLTCASAYLPGCDWSEEALGENSFSPGRVLALDRPVAFVAPDDLFVQYDGSVCTAAPVHDPDGNLIGVVDVSSSIQHGTPWRWPAVGHLVAVIERELQFRRTVRGTESLKLLARMSSLISHEIVNPLTTISTTLSLAMAGDLDERARRLIDRSQGVAKDLIQLVEDLRVLGGSSGTSSEAVLIRTFPWDVFDSLNLPERYQRRVEVCDEAPPYVTVNRRLFTHALGNLARNAAEAMPDGGTIGIRIGKKGASLRFTIWDDGPGIPLLRRMSLFHEAFTTKGSGSGLGLLLVKTIVENIHDGSVSFSPNEPQGAQFHIDLPPASVGPSTPYSAAR